MAQRPLFARRWGGRPAEGDPLQALHREVNRLFEDMSRNFGLSAVLGTGEMGTAAPRIDMCETEGDLRITAELPGVDPKDVEVTLEDDLLTLRGEKRSEQEDKRQSYHVSERSYGSFVRTVRLPFEPEADKVNASFKDGVLTVTLVKPPQERQKARRIAVTTGGSGEGTTTTTEAAPDNAPTS